MAVIFDYLVHNGIDFFFCWCRIDIEYITYFHYNLFYFETSMKATAILFILLTVTFSQSCGKGGLSCDQGRCHYPRYIEGCLTYAADNTCVSCEYNYQINAGICYYAPNTQGLDCCSQFDNSSICVSCSKGLFFNSTSRLCEDRKIEGCLVKANSGCSVCASDFDLVGTICIKSIAGCTAYDQFYNCISCNNSCSFTQGVCVPIPQISIIQNCKYINQYGCAECNSGFRFNVDGSCTLPSLPGCLILGNNGTCYRCQSPYYQLQNGQCVTVGCTQFNGTTCIQCNSALGFTLNNKICLISNCLYFSTNGCTICQNGLVAGTWGCKNSSEKVCLICKIDEYLGNDNQCHPKNVHCTKYQNGVCVFCCDSFYLDQSNTCLQKRYGCIYANGTCSSCISPFSFNNGSCLISGCVSYNAQGCITCDSRLVLNNLVCGLPYCQQISGFTCVSCIAGYQLDLNQNCIQIDINCAVRNSLNVCLQCKTGYQFGNNGICISFKLGCNYVDGICTSCRAPFMYVPKSQSCAIDGCLGYFIGGCSQCDLNYTLLYNSCKLPNCLTSANGKCLECDPDYVFTSRGVCVSVDEFCDKMDEYGTCIKCMSGYYYSKQDKKCIKNTPGCIYDAKNICCSCIQPFIFANGQCTIFGCETLAIEGCSKCSYPFILTVNGICQIANCNAYKNGLCIGCNQGFALNKKSLCVLQDPNCLDYNIEQTKCQTCIKGYRFDDSGRCEYADQHCWSFDSNGICMNCDRIYYLNPYGKCQLRDPQCKTYTNGYCTECAAYYFVGGGVCFANLKGCKAQQSYSVCLVCDDGYNLNSGVCKAQITQLNWNSIDMNFFDDSTQEQANASSSTFTTQFTSSTNLVQAIAAGNARVFYSSSSLNNAQFHVDSQGSNGWSPVGQAQGSYVGIQTASLQTFYAADIKLLAGSSLSNFTLEYSMDGVVFTQIGDYDLNGVVIGSVKTFYFTPVYAKFIRLVIKQGTPNIKFQFYFSSASSSSLTSNSSDNNTYIDKTVTASINGAYGGTSACGESGLCWAGVQACEPRNLSRFSIIYTNCTQKDYVQAVKIDYSMDGITFTCWNNCNQIALTNNTFSFPTPLLAQKVHVHFSKYQGNPRFGIKFSWAPS